MSQYATLLAHSTRLGVQPVLSDLMKSKMLKHFPDLVLPSVLELGNCSWTFKDINITVSNELDAKSVQVVCNSNEQVSLKDLLWPIPIISQVNTQAMHIKTIIHNSFAIISPQKL
jgi:hypothetical protein